MNRRQPIYLMLAAGFCLLIALSFAPYAFTTRSQPNEPPARPLVVAAPAVHTPPAPAESAVKEPEFDAAVWYAAHNEAPETHGVLIESLSGDRLLASHNADISFNPASLIKLATSLVALRRLGADYRFQTRVYIEGKIDKAGVLGGRLYVIGDDPTFGDIGASMIAKELRARGVKRLGAEVSVSADFCFNYSNSAEESAGRLVKVMRLGDPRVSVASEAPSGEASFKLNSHPLRDVLLYMNAHSSNFVAERLGSLVGGADGVRQFLIDELKLAADGITIATVSGRERNRMTPRGVVKVIRALVEEAGRQGMKPLDILPVASDDAGTLRRRLNGTGLEGAVVGKTGTLTSEVDGGMASIAGIVYTTNAGPVVFAVLDQGGRIWESRQLEDQFLTEVFAAQVTPHAAASPTPRRLLPPSNLQISDE